MTEKKVKDEEDHIAEARRALVAAARAHVPFEGWAESVLAASVADCGIDPSLALIACPRGVVDLALAMHREGDAALRDSVPGMKLGALRYSARVAALVRRRIELVGDREIGRAGAAFFALPLHSAEGAAAIWATADLIWTLLGDTSRDLNWYTKRAILAGVLSATLLFWLGDESEDHSATWAFLDRRIADVLGFERFKGKLRKNPLFGEFMRGPGRVLERIHAPGAGARTDLPGHVGTED